MPCQYEQTSVFLTFPFSLLTEDIVSLVIVVSSSVCMCVYERENGQWKKKRKSEIIPEAGQNKQGSTVQRVHL